LKMLDEAGVSSVVYDRSIVRGLDYYTDIVFEVVNTDPENPRPMFGGGRYDGLVEMFGVESLPVVGFGMGDVTLLHFLEGNKLIPDLTREVDAVAILVGDVFEKAQPLLAKLRAKQNIAVDMTGRKMDKKIQSAEKAGATEVIFIGEEEIKSGQVKVKNLSTGQETTKKL